MTQTQTSARPQRILAVVLPHLLCELALQRLPTAHCSTTTKIPTAELPTAKGPAAEGARTPGQPRAITLVDSSLAPLEGKSELDAVNFAAHRLGIRPRQTIAQASAIVENLTVHALPRACVFSALKHIAEVALRFGAPVSFEAPDTVWVDISGSSHLYASEQDLALELAAQIKTLGHSPRVAVAQGPWLAQSFARHAALGEAGILLVDPLHTARAVAQLPIIALPLQREAASWFSRLGLLNLEDLRKLPAASLAARLEGQVLEVTLGTLLDLIQGKDDGILVPHRPEELPREELFWEDPLENVEPLLFVLKGLSGKLSARLEGRGQAAEELLLSIHYDRSMAALAASEGCHPEGCHPDGCHPDGCHPDGCHPEGNTQKSNHPDRNAIQDTKSLSFKLASPLFHAEDLERVMRLRLQRQSLVAPTLGLSLQATRVTEARFCQLGLSDGSAWKSGMTSDPRAMTVLLAELGADIGVASVGLLIIEDSHLLEKSSALLPLRNSSDDPAGSSFDLSTARDLSPWGPALSSSEGVSSEGVSSEGATTQTSSLPRIPTRLLDPPIEIHAPIRKHELWVIREQAFVVCNVHFEQRLEGIEWWDRSRVFRDYFRVWLSAVTSGGANSGGASSDAKESRAALRGGGGGMEALVYRDRVRGKSYLHAVYD